MAVASSVDEGCSRAPVVGLEKREGCGRLLALDALRGFSMFWLLGGAHLVRAATKDSPEGSWEALLYEQFTHVAWDGFRFYDFIFPLFLFCIGMAVPLSVERRLGAGVSRERVVRQGLVRLGWMIFFGWWVNGNLLTWELSKMQLSYSVLMMLGLGYFLATLLVTYGSLRTQVLVTLSVLVGYWVVQTMIPFPGKAAGFEKGAIFSDWLHSFTVGRLSAPWGSPLGVGSMVSMWNCGSMAMLGVFASRVLTLSGGVWVVVGRLVVGGVLLLVVAWVWQWHLPIVKARWTSSYVLWCGGWACLLLAFFHALMAGLGWRRWAGLWVVIGSNSILAYLISTKFMSVFRSAAEVLFGGLAAVMPAYWHSLWMTFCSYGMVWLLLWWFYRQRIFLRL